MVIASRPFLILHVRDPQQEMNSEATLHTQWQVGIQMTSSKFSEYIRVKSTSVYLQYISFSPSTSTNSHILMSPQSVCVCVFVFHVFVLSFIYSVTASVISSLTSILLQVYFTSFLNLFMVSFVNLPTSFFSCPHFLVFSFAYNTCGLYLSVCKTLKKKIQLGIKAFSFFPWILWDIPVREE